MPFCVCADFLVRWYLFFFPAVLFLGSKYLFSPMFSLENQVSQPDPVNS